ncbi:hypothetical protein [Rhodopila globiformis]|uniref:DUF1150 domain-containing protein n=1 Tax=Rhodopila globiformis TaxID=1071 RepID=A0A2S6NGK9_RHOGL|nr:hypothetical protein [Rhodopila globiformis]PPQ33743.1 hypothetical protein CCS01_13820 [Rhodopila globiformis]
MDMQSTDLSTERFDTADDRVAALRQMTAEQLLQLGAHRVAYLKGRQHDGEFLFVLYGADGLPVATADDIDEVAEMASEMGLSFIAVH